MDQDCFLFSQKLSLLVTQAYKDAHQKSVQVRSTLLPWWSNLRFILHDDVMFVSSRLWKREWAILPRVWECHQASAKDWSNEYAGSSNHALHGTRVPNLDRIHDMKSRGHFVDLLFSQVDDNSYNLIPYTFVLEVELSFLFAFKFLSNAAR